MENTENDSIYSAAFDLSFSERMPWSEQEILEILVKKPEYDPKVLKALVLSTMSLLGFALKAHGKYREIKGSEFFERSTKAIESISFSPKDGYFNILFGSSSFVSLLYNILSDERMVKLTESNAKLASEVNELNDLIEKQTTFTKLLVTTAFFWQPLRRIASSSVKNTRDFLANLLQKKPSQKMQENPFFPSEEKVGAFNFYENSFKTLIEETPYAALGLAVLRVFFPAFFESVINPDQMEIAKALGKNRQKNKKKPVVPFYIKVVAFIIAFPFDHPYLLFLAVLLFFFRKAIFSIVFTHFSFFSKQNEELSTLFNYSDNNPTNVSQEQPAAVGEKKVGESSETKEDSAFYTSVKSAYYNFNKPSQQDNDDGYDYDDYEDF